MRRPRIEGILSTQKIIESEPCRVSEPRLYAFLHGLKSLELKAHPRPSPKCTSKCLSCPTPVSAEESLELKALGTR